MASSEALDELYLDIAGRVALMSHGIRAKVGAVIVQGDRIVSYGWNGTPSGDDNACETVGEDGELVTKPDVLHAESNALMKLAASGDVGAQGGTLYVTMSPCKECAKLIKQAKIKRVVFRELYRDTRGIESLISRGVQVEQLQPVSVEPAAPTPLRLPPAPVSPDPNRAAEISRLQMLRSITAKPPVDGPKLVEAPPVPVVRGPELVEAPPVPFVQGPTINEPVIINDVAAALAAAGLSLEDGVPVERPTAKKATTFDEPTGYTSGFA